MKTTTVLTRLLVLSIGLSISLNSCNTESLNPSLNDANQTMAAMKSAKGGVIHHVSAGGADANIGPGQDKPGWDKNYSLVANVMSDGSVDGQYTDRFGKASGGGGFHATVTCVTIDGNRAWITAVGTSGRFFDVDAKGLYIYTSVVDNGKTGDQISFSNGSFTPVDCTTKPSLELFDVLNGQVTVW